MLCPPRHRWSRFRMVLHRAYNCLQGFSDSISVSPLRLNDLLSNYEHKHDIPPASLHTFLPSLKPVTVRKRVCQVVSNCINSVVRRESAML